MEKIEKNLSKEQQLTILKQLFNFDIFNYLKNISLISIPSLSSLIFYRIQVLHQCKSQLSHYGLDFSKTLQIVKEMKNENFFYIFKGWRPLLVSNIVTAYLMMRLHNKFQKWVGKKQFINTNDANIYKKSEDLLSHLAIGNVACLFTNPFQVLLIR